MIAPSARSAGGVAVVTGGAQGLGRAFALALASTEYDVAVLDVHDISPVCAEIESKGVKAFGFSGDASNPHAVRLFVEGVRRTLGRTRVLINNVGVSPYASFADTTLEMWHHVHATNVDSLFLVTHALLDDLKTGGQGRVVNLTSSILWDATTRDMVAYATTKAAVWGFTRSLAGELGEFDVTVNAIAPGIVLTPDITSRVSPETLERYRQRQSIKHLALPEDVTGALAFLVSPAASHITGAVIPINGGRVLI